MPRRNNTAPHPARRWQVPFLLLAFFLAGTFLFPAGALAHAKLLSSTPVAGIFLDDPPTEVTLLFSEGVSLDFSYIKVLDRGRREQAVGVLSHGPEGDVSVRAGIEGELAPGVYTAVWRVVSAVDGHLTAGSFSFRVRAPEGTAEPPEEVEPLPPPEESSPFEGSGGSVDPFRWVVRGVLLACAALLLGGALFTVIVVEPSARDRGEAGAALLPEVKRRFGSLGALAATVLMLMLVFDLVAQVAAIRGEGYLDALTNGDQAGLLLSTTRYGLAWMLKMLAAVVLFAIMLFAWKKREGKGSTPGPTPWDLAVASGSLLLLAEAMSSHAAAAGQVGAEAVGSSVLGLQLPVLSQWLHLATASMWAGGLGYMMLALFPAFRSLGFSTAERRAFLGRSVPRFSLLAVISVALLAGTGTYNLLMHSTNPQAILSSQYGQVLLIKIGVFAALVGLGMVNLLRLSPMLRRAEPARPDGVTDSRAESRGPVGRLRRNVRVEVLLVLIALGLAGGLTLLPPPSEATGAYATPSGKGTALPATTVAESGTPPAPTVEPTPVIASAETSAAGYRVALTAHPSFEGDEFTISIKGETAEAPPLTDVTKVLFRVTPQDIDAGSISYTATETAPGEWSITEPVLTLEGGYLLTVIAQRVTPPDIKAAFRLDLAEDGSLAARSAEVFDVRIATDPSPPITGTATLTITLLNGTGEPVPDATITISPLMPAHAHIEPTDTAEPVPGQPGQYTMPVYFKMGGAWLFIFLVETEGMPPVKLDASLEVEEP